MTPPQQVAVAAPAGVGPVEVGRGDPVLEDTDEGGAHVGVLRAEVLEAPGEVAV